MLKKSISLLLSFILITSICVCFCSCGKNTSSNEFPVTIGETTIQSEPKNVVVLSDNLADIISIIGYNVKMVGKSAETTQDFLKVVPSVGEAQNPSIDAIKSSEADLVIANDTLNDDVKAKLSEAKITVLTLPNATTEEELKNLYVNLGTALGGKVVGAKKGENAYNDLFDTLSTFKSTVKKSLIKTDCYLYLNEAGELSTFTNGTLEKKIFSYNAAMDVFTNQEKEQVSKETLRLSTPSYIFLDNEETLNAIKEDPTLSKLSAIRNNHYLIIPKINFYRQGQTYEDTVYKMIDFMFIQPATEATPDEATIPSIQIEATDSTKETSEDNDLYAYDDADIIGGDIE